ncbi:BLUF domain-containing protein [Novosphingobium sp. ZN18A2]|uniref:BLUF domain-containing protein n=1 Tax=Novosphingobium sp. ZN18A2 TaxID=3079861 RepID=UPI0030CF6AE0
MTQPNVQIERDQAADGCCMESQDDFNCWVYVSESLLSGSTTDKEIQKIVDVSRSRNAGCQITGALIFNGSRFAQLIEGPRHEMAAIRASIMDDPRHTHITTIRDEGVSTRQFASWSLVYSGSSHFLARLLDAVELGEKQQSGLASDEVIAMFAAFATENGPVASASEHSPAGLHYQPGPPAKSMRT